jgi:phosphatidylglycerol:prolipoprotein diacylglycerol transferase
VSLQALLGAITIGLDPVLVKLGPFSLRWYGLMYVVGIAVGLLVLFPYVRKLELPEDAVWNVFWGTAIAALIGGRLYYIVQSDPGSYLSHPGDIFAFWQGGMAYFGAVFLGAPVLVLLSRQQGIPLGYALDCVAVFAPLAQAVGRIGNIINGDVVGYSSNLPWAFVYTNPNSFAPQGVAVQPAGVYELLFSLGLFLVIWPLRFRLRPAGMLFALYLALYSIGQFVVFIWRDNSIVIFGLKQAQATSVVTVALVVAFAALLLRRPAWFDPEYDEAEDATAAEEDYFEDDLDEGELAPEGVDETFTVEQETRVPTLQGEPAISTEDSIA